MGSQVVNYDNLIKLGFEGNEDEVSIPLPTGGGVSLSIELISNDACIVRQNPKKEVGFDYAYIKMPDTIDELRQLYYMLSGEHLDAERFTYKDHEYVVIGTVKDKNTITREWEDKVEYMRVYGSKQKFTRLATEFYQLFKPVKNEIQS